jgi:hypothetical protein
MLLITQTYETVYHEPSKHPYDQEPEHYSQGGIDWQDAPIGFRDLVTTMQLHGFIYPSAYPARGSTFEWVSTDPHYDYETGGSTTKSLHYAQKNHPRKAKYWRKALVAAGIIKVKKDQ